MCTQSPVWGVSVGHLYSHLFVGSVLVMCTVTGNTGHREHRTQGTQDTRNIGHREHRTQGTQDTRNIGHREHRTQGI